MFLCRRLPRQVCIAKRPSGNITLRKNGTSLFPHLATQNHYAYPNTSNTTDNSSSTSISSNSTTPSPFKKHPWFRYHAPRFRAPTTDAETALADYMRMKRVSREDVKSMSAQSFKTLIEHAYQAKDSEALRSLYEDLIAFFPSKRSLVRKMLTTGDHSSLDSQQVLTLIRCLGLPLNLPCHELFTLANRVSQLEPSEHDAELVDSVLPPLLAKLECVRSVPAGANSVTHFVPAEVYAGFNLLYKLVKLEDRNGAWKLFRILVVKLYIPPEAVSRAPTSSKDFGYVISMTLARTCIHWQRRGLGHLIASELLSSRLPRESDGSVSAEVTTELEGLVSDTLYTFLQEPSPADFAYCVNLVRYVHPIAPVHNGLIRLAYDCAFEKNYALSAKRLYAFTRAPEIVETHDYAAPHNRAPLWLLKAITSERGSSQLARTLAEEVADSGISLPVHDRAEFVAVAAAHGFARPARMLWERYSVGRDSHAITGSSKVMLKMVKLFHQLCRRIDAELLARQDTEYLDDQMLRERYDDMVAFTDHVLAKYLTYHQPLEKMQHKHLTTLARAYFVVGQFEKGFQMFRILLDRKEIPDINDINAALTPLAEYNPRTAAKFIERMYERGLQVDEVTFGTVVHQALVAGDMELVEGLITRAKEMGVTRLSPETFVSLIRASVTPDADVIGTPIGTRLQEALKIIKSLQRVGILSSPQLGKYLVFACLRQREPLMAYRFWRLMLRRATDWLDREQVFIRRMISQRLEFHQESQRLGVRPPINEAVMERMLHELKTRPAVRELE
ncbi:hypothetical protein D9758_002586 [Tetrapyrgos nigripes]|uniref:Uncharacterized protein n=1 Tax=Tetrapyrgos nigripes TaxID=182062 RepID=A0A8H5GR09_9AGAR|nr:hypothetical protein D9758_002586 [Tetrapyrgos nigripes]